MINPSNSNGNDIQDQRHYEYLRLRSQKCAEQFFKSRIIAPVFSIPNPREEPLEESIKVEISKNYPKFNLKKYKKPNYLSAKDYFGIAIDFLYEAYSSSLDELCELYTICNTRASITQSIYLSYKTEFLVKKSLVQYLTYFSARYRLQLELKFILNYENEGEMPSSFSQKIHSLKSGKYLVLLSNEVTLALIKLPDSTAFLFDPSLALVRSLNPAKDLWNISSKYGFEKNHLEIFSVSKT